MIEEKQFFILYIMLKNILNSEGVSLLSKGEQKNVNGGLAAGTCAALVTAPNGNQVLSTDINIATVNDIIANGTAASTEYSIAVNHVQLLLGCKK
jgi:hypothetical protein